MINEFDQVKTIKDYQFSKKEVLPGGLSSIALDKIIAKDGTVYWLCEFCINDEPDVYAVPESYLEKDEGQR